MKNLNTIIYISLLIILTSCGEDRSGEYLSLINDDKWIESTMQEKYLWYDQMPVLKPNEYFADPSDFLSKIVFKGNEENRQDIYSYVEDKIKTKSRSYLQRTSSYGFDFELYVDPTETTNHSFARVLFVLPNSPASESGLRRGDWISKVNNRTLNSDNYGYLISGSNSTFTIESLNFENDVLSWKDAKTIDMPSSRVVELNPFYIDTTYVVNNMKISYLVYNEFSTGPSDNADDTQYEEQMKQIFSRFKSAKSDAFILDLRYNPGGYLSQAVNMGSMIAPVTAFGKPFYTLQFNNKTNPQNVSVNLKSDLSSYNLNLNKIYIITSGYTASASEALINCLKPYMGEENVVLIGEKTFGKNVAMSPFTNDDIDFIIWPVVAYVKNSEGFYQYSNGIEPTVSISEKNLISRLLPLGDLNEYLLKNTISYITTGAILDIPTPEKTSKNSAEYCTIYSRRVKGSRL